DKRLRHRALPYRDARHCGCSGQFDRRRWHGPRPLAGGTAGPSQHRVGTGEAGPLRLGGGCPRRRLLPGDGPSRAGSHQRSIVLTYRTATGMSTRAPRAPLSRSVASTWSVVEPAATEVRSARIPSGMTDAIARSAIVHAKWKRLASTGSHVAVSNTVTATP